MKLLNQPEGRTVKYFDIVLTGVPDWANHIATDIDGKVHGYQFTPDADDSQWLTDFEFKLLAEVDLEGTDWKSTLMTIC